MRPSNSHKRRKNTSPKGLDLAREFYAEELRAVANLRSETLVRAFAKVPRERFLGPGPWQIRNPWYDRRPSARYRPTPDADPKHLYHNVLVAIDPERGLNNGEPGFLAFLIDGLKLQEGQHVVHVGCGTGYYTAIIAEVVGPSGNVTAIEIDPEVAARARNNLAYLRHVEVIEGDGGKIDPGTSDAILVNAGATHPQSVWLDSLQSGGRLLLPLTTADEEGGNDGGVLKVRRQQAGLVAFFISGVAIFPCSGARDPESNERLKEAFNRGDWKSVQSLRRYAHERADTCWLHSDDFCLSKLALGE